MKPRPPGGDSPSAATDLDWYEQAWLYDLAFAYPPENEIRILIDAFARFGITDPGLVLEPMVGTGRLIPGLQAAGFRVVGYDQSAEMLAIAARRAPQAALFRALAQEARLAPQFDAAHCLIDSFRYLTETEDAARFFDATIASLKPGGVFLLGLEVEGDTPPFEEEWHVEHEGRRAKVTVGNRGRPAPGQRWLETVIEVEQDGTTRTFRSRRPQRTWSAPELEAFLDERPGVHRVGAWLRTLDLGSPVTRLPQHGGSVILAFQAS